MAGGTGTRLAVGMPKQMFPLFGKPIMAHTIEKFLAFDQELLVMAVLHPSLLHTWTDFVGEFFPDHPSDRLRACAGGAERTHSVYNGLCALGEAGFPDSGYVAIHDAVRPFINDEILSQGFDLAMEKGNAVAGVPVKSSLRMLTDEGSQAIDRSKFFHVQTPQIFSLGEITQCYREQMDQGKFTDDASVAEASGKQIHLFTGSYDNIKITTPEDLVMAERLIERAGDQKG